MKGSISLIVRPFLGSSNVFEDVTQVRHSVRQDMKPGVLDRLGCHNLLSYHLFIQYVSDTIRNYPSSVTSEDSKT